MSVSLLFPRETDPFPLNFHAETIGKLDIFCWLAVWPSLHQKSDVVNEILKQALKAFRKNNFKFALSARADIILAINTFTLAWAAPRT